MDMDNTTAAVGGDTAATAIPGQVQHEGRNLTLQDEVSVVSGPAALRDSTNTLPLAETSAATATSSNLSRRMAESRNRRHRSSEMGRIGGGERTCRQGQERDDRLSSNIGEDAAPESKKRKESHGCSADSRRRNADGETCSICLDAWTSNGKHRVCALLCGHLFGQSCIERWLKERRTCPRCGAKVGSKKTTRVIPLFVQNLVVKDTGELEATRKLLEEEKRLRKQCEAERVRLSIHNSSLKDQLSRQAQNRSRPKPDATPFVARGQGEKGKASSPHHTPMRPTPMRLTPGQSFPPSKPEQRPPDGGLLEAFPRTPLKRDPLDVGQVSAGASGVEAAPSRHEPSPPRRQWHGGRDHLRAHSMTGGGHPGDGSDGGGVGRVEGSESEGAGAGARGAAGESRGVRTEQLLSRDVRGGRVASFAAGAAGALLVSQGFGVAGGTVRHGITKFSLADLRHHKNIHLHREQVRDIKFSADAGGGGGGGVGYVLSTSFDKTLKVCDLRTDRVVVAYGLDGNGWSCQWSATNPAQMFCGLVDGGTRTAAVQLFDLRFTAGAVGKLQAAATQRQPVHSICHTANDLLFCATMGGVWVWGGGTKGGSGVGERREGGIQEGSAAERLQIQAGACCSLSLDGSHVESNAARDHRFLVSTRGSSASHAVFGLDGVPRGASAPAASLRDERLGGEKYGAAADARDTSFGGGDVGQGLAGSSTEQRRPRDRGQGIDGQQVESGHRRVLTELDSTWAQKWRRLPHAAQGHQSQHTLSRSLLWTPFPGADLLIAGGDERTNQPWIWSASTGDVCNRLASHRSPVLDVASLETCSSRRGLFAAVSQGELKVYETSAR